MTLIEHLFELRNRLAKALLGLAVGMIIGVIFAPRLIRFLAEPYCELPGAINDLGTCNVVQQGPADFFLLRLKVGLIAGIILSAPIWLYQLWAFIAPGLHRHERKWGYRFVAVAAPLFVAGVVVAYFAVTNALEFFLPTAESGFASQLNITAYIDFVTGIMLLFGAAFEFPIIVYALNLAGVVSAARLLSFWRIAVFLCFIFAAIATPTPDPFTMIALAAPMSLLYFIAIGAAFLTDRARARKAVAEGYAAVGDDELSPVDLTVAPVDGPSPLDEPDLDPLDPLDPRESDPRGDGATAPPYRPKRALDDRRG